jgi:quercetin dioxygenase-like cupin family protein
MRRGPIGPNFDHMIEMAPQITPYLEIPRSDVVTYHLDPLQRLPQRIDDHTLYVAEGVLYVVLEEDELALTPGDQIGVRAGELKRAWNAGEEVARVVVNTRRPRVI